MQNRASDAGKEKRMKALMVVSFGTSFEGVAERTIGAIECALAAAFPDRVLYSAWTSKFICAKVERETGVHHMQVEEACAALVAAGVDDLLVQPTFLMQSHEYELMLEGLRSAAADIPQARIGDTLLACADDCAMLAQALAETFVDMAEDEALVLMGHGSDSGNEVYAAMQDACTAAGHGNFIVGTVEGTPDFDDVKAQVNALNPARVWLAPFMIVAGDHANNDLAGDEPDSWKNVLEAAGYPCTPVLRGLGEYPQVQALFVEHAHRALEGQGR